MHSISSSEYVHELNRLESVWGRVSDALRAIKEAIKAGGKIKVSVLGAFCSNNKTVYLYLTTIERTAQSESTEITKPLITTFIHEMFHAWNYFASNSHDKIFEAWVEYRTVEEIDEAMVECYTLLFLQDISKSMPEFETIFEWAKKEIQSKQSSIGKQSAYGFGYHLFSLWNTKGFDTIHHRWQLLEVASHDHTVGSGRLQKILEVYGRKSSWLNIHSGLVKSIQGKFTPIYPRNEEADVFELFYKVIVSGGIKGQVWSPSGKTNIITDGDNLLFENNVDEVNEIGDDDLFELYRLFRVKEGNQFKIYCSDCNKWFPLFEETFSSISSMYYGTEPVVFLKAQKDGRIYMLTSRDIIIICEEILNNNIKATNTISLIFCISADEFYKFEDNEKPIIIAKNGDAYDYIFPMFRSKPRSKPKVIHNINFHPLSIGVEYFQAKSCDYVYINESEKIGIYTLDGMRIGEYEYFAPPVIDGEYSMCQKNGEWNFYSFEKKEILFEKWFSEVGFEFRKDGDFYFPVAENDVCKIVDINGFDVSYDFPEELSTWKKDYEELKLVHSQI